MQRATIAVLLGATAGCTCLGVVGDVDHPAAPSTVSGTVLADGLCEPVEGATVTLLGGGPSTVSGPDGRYQLAGVPAGSVLQVSGPGLVTTLSATATFPTQVDGVDLAALRGATAELAPFLSGLPANPSRGVVVLLAVDGRQFPVGGVAVNLLRLDGEPAPGERRYGVSTGPLLAFNDRAVAATDDSLGAVAFFDVPAGSYQAQASRDGYTFAPLSLEVAAGAVTMSLYPGEGDGGVVPVEVWGTLRLAAPSCPGGAARPAVGAHVVVHEWGDGGTFETTTNDGGEFRLAVPFFRRMVDVTVSAAGYPATRTRGFCALPTVYNSASLPLFDSTTETAWLNLALGDQLLAGDAGYIEAVVVNQMLSGGRPVAGATLRLEPAVAAPAAYDVASNDVNADACATRGCAVAADCPDGTRCELGECLLGATGPLCERCDGGACPPGFRGEWVHNQVVGGPACHCLPERTRCPPAEACPPGTFCFAWGVCGGTPLRDVCLPFERPRRLGTSVDVNGESLYSMIPNVPEGLYRLYADLDGGFFYPSWVRVSPGVGCAVGVEGP